MRFRKEVTIVIEGEAFDSISPIEIFKSLRFSWRHWWENNPNWVYGTPSDKMQSGRVDRIFLDKMEIKNEQC